VRVLAVVGPTAAGKSDLGIALAQAVGGEVVNADSMQLYRGHGRRHRQARAARARGSAAPPARRLAGHPHGHRRGLPAAVPWRRRRPAGPRRDSRCWSAAPGLYLRAALDELDFPGTDPELRAALEADLERDGPLALHARLAALDPAAATRMEPTNGRRIVRALEVVALTGSMPGELASYGEHYPTCYVGVDRPDLAERIEVRVDRMWEAGLVDEVRRLEGEGLREGVTASRALGYAQVLGALDGRWDEAQARDLTVTATRRFARRQRAWFRRDPRVTWLDPDAPLLPQALAALG
jgi:tRNA dimethylallyltransferase